MIEKNVTMVINQTEDQERDYLQKVINILKSTINKTDFSVQEHVDTLAEYKEYLWSNKDIDPQEIRSMRESILNHFAIGRSVIDRRMRLAKIIDIPYFGRIDFKEDSSNINPKPIYIGIHSFFDSNNRDNLIFDWRAPISGMFYDFELGEASYITPAGKIVGNIFLKRQFRIRNGKMEYMIESSLAIHDDILQKVLSTNSDDKMRNIVTTIQREQNSIIRNEEARALIIQGVAGSGKTSIALHRVAYLLYVYKSSLLSKDILIISPNKVFANYISNVLPELGEEVIPEIEMEQLLTNIIENKYKFQTFFEQVDELLNIPNSALVERIQYKASLEFIFQLDKFLIYIENNYFQPKDIQLTGQITIPAKYLYEQFQRFHRYPIRMRFDPMVEYISEYIQNQYHIQLSTSERNLFKKKLRNMFAGNNDLQVYKDFYKWVDRPNMVKLRKNRVLEYSDLAPLAYIRIVLNGLNSFSQVKHLLVDEMQDYSPIQYKVISRLFTCRKTILGDACQSVNPYGSSTADMIKTVLGGDVVKLRKSYRSTCEIMALAQQIKTNDELEMMDRHGQKPKIIQCESNDDELKLIVELVFKFKMLGYKSLGIICKDDFQASNLFSQLRDKNIDLFYLSSQSSTFTQGIIVTSAHMAKGLEFDEVIIPFVTESNFRTEIDRSMLYVAVTRAMHRLTLTYTGRITLFLKAMQSLK